MPYKFDFKRTLSRVASGLLGGVQVPAGVLRNLRWFWLDGFFSQASESIVNAYLSLFILALGASRAQIGLLSAVSNLSAALVMLPGAALVERWGHRKELCVWSGGGVGRLMLLLMALSPFLVSGPLAVYILIGLAVLRVALGNLTVPAWVSLTADLVPLSVRGRYLSARNMAMGLVGMATAWLMGQLIARMPGTSGYQMAIGLAFAIGMVSTWSFAHIKEPHIETHRRASSAGRPSLRRLLATLWRDLRTQPAFLTLCAVDALWNFSLNIAGPFFSPYLVQTLGADTRMVGTLTVINVLSALPGQRLFGVWTDRWGPRRVLILTALLIPLVPWGWALTRAPWQAIPAEMASGFLWAGYGLASFNFLLLLIPEARRPRYTALYQLVVMMALSAGAAVGGLVATRWGYRTTMVISGIGRLTAALLFVGLMRLPPAGGTKEIKND